MHKLLHIPLKLYKWKTVNCPRLFASRRHDGGGCCQMFRLVGKLQWKHPAPAKWDEGRNYICEKEIALNIKHSNRNWIFRTVTLDNSYSLGIFADNKLSIKEYGSNLYDLHRARTNQS